MLLAIFNTILSSIGSILWKKALDLSKLPRSFFIFLGMPVALIPAVIFIIGWYTKDFYQINIILAMCIIILFTSLISPITYYLYRNEKNSVLLPYENLDKIFTVILGFFYFKNTSLISFIITLCAVVIIIIFTINFKKLTLPKNIWFIILRAFLIVIKNLFLASILVKISSITYFTYNAIIYSLVLFVPIFIRKDYNWLKECSKDFYINRFWTAVIWQIASFISLLLLEKQWIIISNLLGFLGIWVSFLFWYLILKDKPTKKDISQAIIVCILVWLGYYFK